MEPESGDEQLLPMQQFFAASVRGLIEGQRLLDEHGREQILTWDQHGIPPTLWTWSECRLRFAVDFTCQPRSRAGEPTQLMIGRRSGGQASLTLSFRYIETPQDGEERS